MGQLIKELIEEYCNSKLTWHDIQDIIEGRLLTDAFKKGEKETSLRQIAEEEDKILKEIERGIYLWTK